MQFAGGFCWAGVVLSPEKLRGQGLLAKIDQDGATPPEQAAQDRELTRKADDCMRRNPYCEGGSAEACDLCLRTGRGRKKRGDEH